VSVPTRDTSTFTVFSALYPTLPREDGPSRSSPSSHDLARSPEAHRLSSPIATSTPAACTPSESSTDPIDLLASIQASLQTAKSDLRRSPTRSDTSDEMGNDGLPLLESREPEEVRKWVGRMQLWLELKEIAEDREMLRAQAGIRVDKIVEWYTLDKAKYRALSFEAWLTELLAYVTPTNYLDDLLDKVSTAQQQPGELVDDYLCALRSDNNRLPLTLRLSDERLRAVIRTGLNTHLKARMRLDATLRTTTSLRDLASGLVKLEEVVNLDHAQACNEASRQSRREL
jgi:hypothetical protein